jgi:hypothetical protein
MNVRCAVKTKHRKQQIKGKAWRSHVANLKRRGLAAHAVKQQGNRVAKPQNPLLFNV